MLPPDDFDPAIGIAEILEPGLRRIVALADALVRFVAEGLAARLAAGVRRERETYSWDRLSEAVERLAAR